MQSAPHLGRTVRNMKRYGEILTVLAKHGFEDFLGETGLGNTLEKGLRLLGRQKTEDPHSRPQRLRMAIEDLGPTFMKLGQVLSMRPDLIPPSWAAEFRQLQDACPQVPFTKIRARLEEEFPDRVDEVFPHIEEEPLAAGSMAQVHRAILADGSKVIVKLLRPGIEELLAADMEVLATIAQLVENYFRNLGYSPTEIVAELSRELQTETDLGHEGRATERLRRCFEEDPGIEFPHIHSHVSTRRVLVMEEITGVLLSRRESGELTPDELRGIVRNCADAVFRQCLEIGFFHADPHPGNIFALPGGRVCFIDCGMTGHIDQRTADDLADLVYAVVTGDLDRVIRAIMSLTDIQPALADSRAFRTDTWELISHFETGTLESLDTGAMLQELFETLRRHRVRCPSDIVFLIKAITTLEALCAELDPAFDVVAHVAPRVKRLVSGRMGMRAVTRRLQTSALDYAELLEDLPHKLQGLLEQLRRNDFSVSLEHRRLDRLTDTIEHASRNIAHALIIAALVVGSSILILADRMGDTTGKLLSTLGAVGLALAGGLTLLLVVANWRRRPR